MNHIEESTTDSAYRSVRALKEWLKLTRRKINEEQKHIPGSIILPHSKWEKYTCYYFIETLNFPELQNEVRDHLIDMTAANTAIPKDIIRSCFNSARVESLKMYDLGTPKLEIVPHSIPVRRRSEPKRSSRTLLIPNETLKELSSPVPTLQLSDIDADKAQMTKLKIGHLHFEVPTRIFERLTIKAEQATTNNAERDDLIIRLFLRYNPLGPGTGFFWSMDNRVYKFLEENNGGRSVIEGFASPFNHNLDNFCSAFNEDMKFGSRGSFFDYISALDIPVKMIANPPYTLNVLNKAADVCIDYIERVPGSECIMMYPDWRDSEGIKKLMNHPKCQYKIFKNQEYTVHDYSQDKVIMTPMSLIFFIISSGTPSVSIDDMAEKIGESYNETVAGKSPRWLDRSVGSPIPSPGRNL